jgi:sugar phosphate permease
MAFLSSPALSALVWLSPLLAGIVHDKVTRGRVHPVYIITTAGLFVGATRVLVAESDAWLRVGRPILDAFL